MDLRTPGKGEIVAAIGALLMLFGLIALPWYDVAQPAALVDGVEEAGFTGGTLPESLGAWEQEGGLGTLANIVILVAGLAALVAAGAAAIGSRFDASGVPLAALSALAVIAVVVRMIDRPEELDEDVIGVPFEFEAGLEIGIWIALAGALVQLVGSLMRLRRGPEPAPTTPAPARGSPS